MRFVGSFLVSAAALFPVVRRRPHLHRLDPRLRWYCLTMAAHGAIQGLMLLAGVSIQSETYGFEWYLARTVQVLLAFLYFVTVTRVHNMPAAVSLSIFVGLAFGVSPLPTVWFSWLALLYSFTVTLLGLNIVTAKDATARVMGLYWLTMGFWQYAFARLSADPASIVWGLNWWLPSTISVSAFLALAYV